MSDTSNTDTTTTTDTTDKTTTDRPGGPPARSLADERIERLEATVTALSTQLSEQTRTAISHKEAKRTVEQDIEELRGTLSATAAELETERIKAAASKVGAKNPATIARLVAGSENPEAAIEQLRKDEPYLFGVDRPAGADMSGGSSGGGGLEDFDKHMANRFSGPAR